MHDINKLNSENICIISFLFLSAIFQTFFCTLDIVLPYTKFVCKLYLFHTYCSFQKTFGCQFLVSINRFAVYKLFYIVIYIQMHSIDSNFNTVTLFQKVFVKS